MKRDMQMGSNEQQILKLFEDSDRALIAADVAELSRIFADDYIQYDEFGEPRTRQDLPDAQTSGTEQVRALHERPNEKCETRR
jgi:hypothetical protein